MDLAAKMLDYIKDFIEKSHPSFDGLPICPFARRARVKGLIQFEIKAFKTVADVMEMIDLMKPEKEVIIMLHPDIGLKELKALLEEVEKPASQKGFGVFHGHPEEAWKIGECYSRRDPVANIQAVKLDLIQKSAATLPERYYSRWTAQQRKDVSNQGESFRSP